MSSLPCPACGAENPSASSYCSSCGTTLAVDPTAPGAAAPRGVGDTAAVGMLGLGLANSDEEALVGETIAHFEIESLLGAGGMGRVFLARDIQLGRKVALKFLTESLTADPEARERFLREARSASKLDHPNIGTIYEAGDVEDVLYIAMAFYDGETLRDRLKRTAEEPLALGEALSILRQTSSGLSAAHQAGIIHRDIKPGNIMITGSGQVKILDFGLAKPAQKSDGPDTGLTVTGTTIGTVAYMSPEQAKGVPVDERTDIWSLGVLAYEILAGRRPFEAHETVAMLSRILTEPPQPLERPDLPDALVALIDEMLQKDRDERVGSVAEVERQIASIALGEERTLVDPGSDRSTAAPVSAGPAERKSWWTWVPRRARISAAAVGVAGVMLLLVGPETVVDWIENIISTAPECETCPGTVVVTDFMNSTDNPALAGTLGPGLSSRLQASEHLDTLTPTEVRETLEQMERPPDQRLTREIGLEICERRGLPAMTAGRIAALGANYILTLEAVECTTGESVAAAQIEVGSEEQVLAALDGAATELTGELVAALDRLERFETPLAEATTDSIEALRSFSAGVRHRDQEGHLAAISFFERALDLDPDFAQAEARLGSSLLAVGRKEEGRARLARAFELREAVSERERFYILAQYYASVVGDQRKATEVCQQWTRTFEDDAEPRISLASQHRTLGQYERSLAAGLEATKLAPGDREAWLNVVLTRVVLGQLEEAVEALDSMEESGLGTDGLDTIRARIAMASGDEAAARQVLADEGEASDGRETASLAWFLAGQGRLDDARALAERAVALCERSNDRSCASYARLGLAETLLDLGLDEEAGTLVSEAVAAYPPDRLAAEKEIGGWSAILLARIGRRAEATELMAALGEAWPQDTILQEIARPIFEATLTMIDGDAQPAIESLEIARPYGRPDVLQARGLAYLELGRPALALAQLERLASLTTVYDGIHRQTLAPLWLARAQVASGDLAAARKSYAAFLELMAGADDGVPLVVAARRELSEIAA